MKIRIMQFQMIFIVTSLFIKNIISTNCSITFGSSITYGYSIISIFTDIDYLLFSYDQNYIYGVEFNYTYGDPNQYTNFTIVYKTEIKNEIISGIKIQSDRFINTLQFEIFDPFSNKTSWTPIMGSSVGINNSVYLSAASLNSSYFNIQFLNQSIQTDYKIFGFPFLRQLEVFYESENCYFHSSNKQDKFVSLETVVIISISITLTLIFLALLFYILYKKKKLKSVFCQRNINSEFDVFLSYSHKDKNQADKIFNLLKSFSFSVWMDRFEIKIGDDFAERIHTGIRNSNFFLALLSKNYIESENCCNEFKLARHLNKKVFIATFETVRDLETSSIGLDAMGIKNYKLCGNSDFSELVKDLSKLV